MHHDLRNACTTGPAYAIQCIFDEIMIFHLCITPFESSIYTVKSWYAKKQREGLQGMAPGTEKVAFRSGHAKDT